MMDGQSIICVEGAGTQCLPAPIPPKPRRRKTHTGELNRLVHRAIDRRDIDLVDVIADEVAKDHPEILLPNAFGNSVRDALELRRGQIARELEWWL
jgi:hypothetical protein